MTRVVSLFLPTLSTDRVRRKSGDAAPPAEAPLVLIGRDGRRRVVLAADAAAQAAGLRVGMPATKAQVLVPGLIDPGCRPAGRRRGAGPARPLDAAALRADRRGGSARWDRHRLHRRRSSAWRRSRDACDAGRQAGGCRHSRARRRRRYLGRGPRAGALRGAPGLRLRAGSGATDVAPLPIAALRLAPDMVDGLRVLGFERVGDLLAQPRAPLDPALRARARPPAGSGQRPAGRTHRADPSAGADRGPSRLRRADRRGGNHRALHRQARHAALRRRSSRRGSARGGSISSAIASTAAPKPCASARHCRSAMPSG